MNLKYNLPCIYERLKIREFNNNDLDSLMDFTIDPDQLKYMMFSLSTKKEIEDFLEFVQIEANKEKRFEWHLALEEIDKPVCIGSVALMIEKESPVSAELGYWFKHLVWGKGYATEASRYMLDLGFKTLGLHRIWGKCHIDNPASANVMQKLGMKLEGQIREHVWLRDHYRSSLIFSILENEYNK